MSLRVANYGKDLSLFVKSKNYPGYYEINFDVNYRYFTKLIETSPTDDIFLIEKPDTCYRVFVFGGSTTRGFPYQAGTSFPRILYYRLQDAFPNKRIEVVNLSASAINSYTYIDMIDEVLDAKPDLILVYGGHNEYYGAMGVGSIERGGNFRWMKKLNLKLNHFKIYQFLKSSIVKIQQKMMTDSSNRSETLMSRIVKDKSIGYGSKLYQRGVEQFQLNMTELVKKSVSHNVPIVLSELVCNVHDLAPLQSIKTDEYPAAIDVFHQAQVLESEGKLEEAGALYDQAKDLDVIRFRAPEAMNEIIRELSAKYQLPMVPMKKEFENVSPHQLIGEELILEHLHPNIEGYFLMADAFFKTLKKNQLIGDWVEEGLKPAEAYRRNWGFTELDSLIADITIKSLKGGWPFHPEDEPNVFLKNYQTKGVVDSMAFHYLISPVRHIEDEHIKLAVYYAGIGQNEMAFQEYLSLIKLHPYIADLYYDASKYLIAQKKYQQAFDLIQSAPLMPHDYFYYYMNGTLKLSLGKSEKGIKDLEYALQIVTPEDNPIKVLIPLYVAYRDRMDTVNKDRIVAMIKKYQPDFKLPEDGLKPGVERIKISITEIYDRALLFIKRNENDKALDLLLKTDKVTENALIKKLIGMIYFQQKNYAGAFYFCSKSFELNPNDHDNLNNYFILLLMKKDMKRAAEILQLLPSLKIAPDKIERFERLYNKRENEIKTENPN
ncbi:MAG: GDSL-type esterase/lipase family protein [Prolixibacteraceae bacterium]